MNHGATLEKPFNLETLLDLVRKFAASAWRCPELRRRVPASEGRRPGAGRDPGRGRLSRCSRRFCVRLDERDHAWRSLPSRSSRGSCGRSGSRTADAKVDGFRGACNDRLLGAGRAGAGRPFPPTQTPGTRCNSRRQAQRDHSGGRTRERRRKRLADQAAAGARLRCRASRCSTSSKSARSSSPAHCSGATRRPSRAGA